MGKYDAIVVGAGIAGLSAGALLAKRGKKVLVLEKNKDVGGSARTYNPFPGYYIDDGGHLLYLSTKGALAEVYQKVGKSLPELGRARVDGGAGAMEIYEDGQWKRLADMTDPGEAVKVFDLITKLKLKFSRSICYFRSKAPD